MNEVHHDAQLATLGRSVERKEPSGLVSIETLRELKKKAAMALFAGALSSAILHALLVAVDFPDPALPRTRNSIRVHRAIPGNDSGWATARTYYLVARTSSML